MRKDQRLVMLMYAAGFIGISIFTQVTVKWYQYFYAPPIEASMTVLVPLGFVGLAMIIARVFDSVADPLVAYYSDNLSHPLGRRVPFVLYGSVPLALSFIMLWFPPVEGPSIFNGIYLTVMLSIFFIFFTVVVAPYLALVNEMTRTNSERVSLTTLQGGAQIVGVIVAEAGSGLLINLYGFRIMGLSLGLLALAALLLTPIFVREDTSYGPQLKAISLWSSIRLTFSNSNFLCLLVTYNAGFFGINTITIALPYINKVLLRTTAEASGLMTAASFLTSLLFIPAIPTLSARLGRKKLLMAASLLVMVALMLCGLFGTVLSYNAAFVVMVLTGIPMAVMFVIPNALLADVAELDSIMHGMRRESMFFGARGLITKATIGLSSFVTPLLFNTFGYSLERPLGLQLCGPLAGLSVLIGAFFLNRYDICEEHMTKARLSRTTDRPLP